MDDLVGLSGEDDTWRYIPNINSCEGVLAYGPPAPGHIKRGHAVMAAMGQVVQTESQQGVVMVATKSFCQNRLLFQNSCKTKSKCENKVNCSGKVF